MPAVCDERIIVHVDADCFYVSCHRATGPAALRGAPLAVAGSPARRAGVVLCASYEARRQGVRGGMSLAEALGLCPDLQVVDPDFGLYRRFSARLHALLADWSPVVEPFSIDEAWCDLTGCPGAATPLRAAATLQDRIERALDLPVSVGIGPNKLLAKMASALHKPRGLAELRRADVPVRLWPLPVGRLFGVGPALSARLARWNVRTIGDLAALGPAFCERHLGHAGVRLWQAAHGRDDAPVDPGAGTHPRSVGCSVTLDSDIAGPVAARPVLLGLAARVASRLRAHGLCALAVTVTLRDTTFRDHSRSRGLPAPTDSAADLLGLALELAGPLLGGPSRFRLLGVAATRVVPAAGALRPLSLLDSPAQRQAALRRRQIELAADRVRARFGEHALVPAALVPRRTPPRQAG